MGPLATIKRQVREAASDLGAYPPVSAGWQQRAASTAATLVPWLVQNAAALKNHVQDVLNAPHTIRSLWATINKSVGIPAEQAEAFERLLRLDDLLREAIPGEVISKVVSRFLVETYPENGLRENGPSDYPDLYLSALSYSMLPVFKRKKSVTADDEYGASVKGPGRRPARVPDGLEIKTCRDKVAVDCHHPHAGLHLVLLFTEARRQFTVTDIRAAFLRPFDYRESERRTTATTVKYSFGGDKFVSLLPTPSRPG